jgi:hypothetical protein
VPPELGSHLKFCWHNGSSYNALKPAIHVENSSPPPHKESTTDDGGFFSYVMYTFFYPNHPYQPLPFNPHGNRAEGEYPATVIRRLVLTLALREMQEHLREEDL